ncbi:hypothetical protein Mal64_00550 [Pseudobythopirellula maris]|uniref:Uncharacterized protein n=1 Tax=Pseudobythopirellula maris TaxID=2527991 RepID=A0A5C5ZR27_9BACT|nr:hypothetical protein [Pseudobythopirellula maris]TWT89676.1 hypothetical protein Mal64_00550 [Pseudobythopirellula maris]
MFDPNAYGPVIADLLKNVDRARPIDAGEPDERLGAKLSDVGLDEAFAHAKLADPAMARCCLAALWLLADDLEASHAISQGVDTPAGSYWHGVMHRREGDFGNAKYWFRRAGGSLVEAVEDPAGFVDQVEDAINSGDKPQHAACSATQQAEWEELFDWCYEQAVA